METFAQYWAELFQSTMGDFDADNATHARIHAIWESQTPEAETRAERAMRANMPRSTHVAHSVGSAYRQGQALRRIQKKS